MSGVTFSCNVLWYSNCQTWCIDFTNYGKCFAAIWWYYRTLVWFQLQWNPAADDLFGCLSGDDASGPSIWIQCVPPETAGGKLLRWNCWALDHLQPPRTRITQRSQYPGTNLQSEIQIEVSSPEWHASHSTQTTLSNIHSNIPQWHNQITVDSQ